MEYALGGLLVVFLIYLFIETRRKSRRILQVVLEEKRAIANDSGMTASLGVFTPDLQTTLIIGASEEMGVFYYRMIKQAKVIIRSRINLANLARTEFLINGNEQPVGLESEQVTTSLRATDIADRVIASMAQDSIRQIERAALRVNFYDESGSEKSLEITTLRAGDERQRFERVQLLKNTVWWTAFLQIASRNARRVRARIEDRPEEISE